MNWKSFVILLFVSVSIAGILHAQGTLKDLRGPYLGQKAPSVKAGIFLDQSRDH